MHSVCDCLPCRRELDEGAANSWGFQAPSEKRSPQPTALSLMPTAVASRKAGKSSILPAFDQDAAAQQAFKREAVSRRLHDKEFHAKQSIRKRQQEYDQAVKARLAQDAAMSSNDASGKSDKAHLKAKHAQHAPHAEQLPDVTAAVGGAGLLTGSMAGPRARKLQAFARQPRLPQLPPPPRQQSRIPDDVLLPDITGRSSKQLAYNSNSMDDLLMEDDTPRQRPVSVMEEAIQSVLLPPLVSQSSTMRRLTQEVPS